MISHRLPTLSAFHRQTYIKSVVHSLAALDVDAFERLLGPCVELMKRNMVSYDADLNKAFNRFE